MTADHQAELTALRAELDAALAKLGEAERERHSAERETLHWQWCHDSAVKNLRSAKDRLEENLVSQITGCANAKREAMKERDTALALVERYGKALRTLSEYDIAFDNPFTAAIHLRVMRGLARDAIAPVAPVAGQRGEGRTGADVDMHLAGMHREDIQ